MCFIAAGATWIKFGEAYATIPMAGVVFFLIRASTVQKTVASTAQSDEEEDRQKAYLPLFISICREASVLLVIAIILLIYASTFVDWNTWAPRVVYAIIVVTLVAALGAVIRNKTRQTTETKEDDFMVP